MYKVIYILMILSSGAMASVEIQEKFLNKHYLRSFLQTIYGKEIEILLNEKITSRGDAFGGACDQYSIIVGGKKTFRENLDCQNGMHEIINSPFSMSSPIRSLLLNETCERIVSNKKALRYSLGGEIPPFNFKNFKKYAGIFRLRVNKIIFKKIKLNNKSPWAFTSKVFCRSERWQKP